VLLSVSEYDIFVDNQHQFSKDDLADNVQLTKLYNILSSFVTHQIVQMLSYSQGQRLLVAFNLPSSLTHRVADVHNRL
jgi:hypothetical protein